MLVLKGTLWSVSALILSVALGACSMRVGDFTVASTKNIGQLSQKGDTVVGEDCSTKLLIFIPVEGPVAPNVKTAVDRALEKAKGDVIADVVVWETRLPLLIINQWCFKVEGKVARAELGKK